MCAGCLYDLTQELGILEHRAGTQVVAVEGLAFVVCLEERTLQHLENAVVMDVRIGEVDEHARLRIAVGVDVEIVAASCNTSANVLAVVLEVHRIEAYIAVLAANLANSLDHIFALLDSRHQLRCCVVANRHQMEVEAKTGALFLQKMEEIITGDSFNVGSCVADGCTKENTVLLQKIHSLHDSGVVSVAAARIVGVRCALDGEHEGDVAKLANLFAHLVGDQCGVGVQTKEAVIVFLRQLEDIVHANGGFAAGHHVEVYAELLALRHDLIHVLKGKVGFMAIGAGPTSDAVHITCHGGIEQNQPRDVAVVFLTVGADGLGTAQECLVAQIQKGNLGIVGIRLINDPVDIAEPAVIRILDGGTNRIKLLLAGTFSVEIGSQIHNFKVGFSTIIRILNGFQKAIDQNGHGLPFCRMGQIFKFSSHSFLLLLVLLFKHGLLYRWIFEISSDKIGGVSIVFAVLMPANHGYWRRIVTVHAPPIAWLACELLRRIDADT